MSDEDIELAFRDVKLLVGRMIAQGENLRDEVLSSLFRLNNEIGKRARTSQQMKEELTPLQHHVNAITVAVKNSDSELMQQSVRSAEEILGKRRKGASETKKFFAR